MTYFTADFFQGNRARLRELFTGTAPIVIAANGLLQRGAEIPFAFQQDGSFLYLTGIDVPDLILVMDKDKEYLIVPTREDVREAFDGAVDFDHLSKVSGIKTIINEKEGWKQLGSRLKKVKHVATLAANPNYIEVLGVYTSPVRRTLIRKMKTYNDQLELLDLREHLARMRMIKHEPEIQAIQAAIDITIDSLKDALRPAKLKSYRFEYELEAEIGYGFRKRGAMGHAFDPIVAAGMNAATIHSMKNESPIHARDLITLDVGAEVEHYDADITRTISMNGKPTRRQQAIYDAVYEVQEFAFGLQMPGVSLRDNEKEVETFMGEKLRELGLIKSIKHDTVRKYYPHALSHFLGIDPHDAGDYDLPLEPGVVLTVEPGIYIPEEGIGVRLEDDVLITADGYKNLSARLPRKL